MSKLYRFISFESFVDMVQNQSLIFVNPKCWDDPKELQPFKLWIEDLFMQKDDGAVHLVEAFANEVRKNKLYAQSWTILDESDALWRIYSHNNFSVRIAIDIKDIDLLDNVIYEKVKYTNDFSSLYNRFSTSNIFCVKRKLFPMKKK